MSGDDLKLLFTIEGVFIKTQTQLQHKAINQRSIAFPQTQ